MSAAGGRPGLVELLEGLLLAHAVLGGQGDLDVPVLEQLAHGREEVPRLLPAGDGPAVDPRRALGGDDVLLVPGLLDDEGVGRAQQRPVEVGVVGVLDDEPRRPLPGALALRLEHQPDRAGQSPVVGGLLQRLEVLPRDIGQVDRRLPLAELGHRAGEADDGRVLGHRLGRVRRRPRGREVDVEVDVVLARGRDEHGRGLVALGEEPAALCENGSRVDLVPVVLREPGGAVVAGLLVAVGEHDDVPVELRSLVEVPQQRADHRRVRALHVQGAAPVDLAVDDRPGEGVLVPVLLLDRHDVGVPEEQQRLLGAGPGDPRDEVDVVLLRGVDDLDGHARLLPHGLEHLRVRAGVAAAAVVLRVEGEHPREQVQRVLVRGRDRRSGQAGRRGGRPGEGTGASRGGDADPGHARAEEGTAGHRGTGRLVRGVGHVDSFVGVVHRGFSSGDLSHNGSHCAHAPSGVPGATSGAVPDAPVAAT